MLDAWRNGDEAALAALVGAGLAGGLGSASLHDALFTERNRTMASSVREHLAAGGQSFVVVGAAHLVGEGSLVELLRAGGASVERMGSTETEAQSNP